MIVKPDSLGRVGIWSRELRFHVDRGAARDAAAELDSLGYGALWIPDTGGDVIGAIREMLDATRSTRIATGILNIWMHDPSYVAREVAALTGGERFVTGLGSSHGSIVDAEQPGRYEKPLTVMREYLDALDVAQPALPAPERILAALGPRMLALSRDRAAGAHPYMVPPEHTAQARDILGGERLLAPEQGVYLTNDLDHGFEVARATTAQYLALPNYVANFRRLGFDDADFVDGGSRRLVDAVIAYGDEQVIVERVSAHLAAGADHVCVQVIGQVDDGLAVEQWRRLAPALLAR